MFVSFNTLTHNTQYISTNHTLTNHTLKHSNIMVKKKGKSKRTTLKDKYKMQRRVVETHRKSRKQAKRDAKAGIVRHDKKKKDPGIPNSWPFKQDLLRDIARANERAEENLAERKKAARSNNAAVPMTMEELAGRAAQSQAAFAAKQTESGGDGTTPTTPTTTSSSLGQSSRRAYLRECRKVLDRADVILQVLDARDPLGTRVGRSVEDAILSRSDRRMVLVLNKVDLVPKTAVAGWLTWLRRSHPTVAVRAGLSESFGGRAKGDRALLRSTDAIGMEGLLGLLKNYARCGGSSNKRKSKTCITVGVVGYPNVGKSSIVNSLKRARAVGVSARPGFTTCTQEVVLDKNVRLLDAPGVVFDDSDSDHHCLLRNCVDVDTVEDPLPTVEALLSRCTKESLMMTYAIPAFGSADMFLAMVAKKLGKLRKGGVPDKVMAARQVLRDWNGGKIAYYTPVPTTDETMDTTATEEMNTNPVILKEFGAEFDVQLMESLSGDKRDELDFVQLIPSTAPKHGNDTARMLTDDDDDMEDENVDGSDKHENNEEGMVDNAAMKDAEDYDFGDTE